MQAADLNTPILFITTPHLVDYDEGGSELDLGRVLRVAFCFRKGSPLNETFLIPQSEGQDFTTKDPVKLLDYAADHSERILDCIQFNEENYNSVDICGVIYNWDELYAKGYEFRSPAVQAPSPEDRI